MELKVIELALVLEDIPCDNIMYFFGRLISKNLPSKPPNWAALLLFLAFILNTLTQ